MQFYIRSFLDQMTLKKWYGVGMVAAPVIGIVGGTWHACGFVKGSMIMVTVCIAAVMIAKGVSLICGD